MSVNALGPAPLPEKSEPVALTAAPYCPSSGASTSGKTPVTAFDKPNGPSFSDLIDVINPLQHIPVVNMIYQKLTGDTEGAIADVVGGAIYGGFIGLGAAVAGLMVHEATGKTLGDNMFALFTDDSSSTAVAQAASKTQTAQAAKPAAAEPPPVAAAPLPAVGKVPLNSPATVASAASAAATSGQGPMRAGDYLVFGGSAAVTVPTASSNRPVGLTPTASTAATAPPTPPAAASAPGPGRNGDFLVFGNNVGPMPTALPGDEALDPKAQAAAAVSRQLQQTATTGDQPRMHPVPARIGKSAPPSVLPMPTTGPGAIPGGHSQALSANGMGASASPLDTATASPNDANQWFAGAFSQAMDKYQRASRLGGDASQTMPPPAPATSDSAAATLN